MQDDAERLVAQRDAPPLADVNRGKHVTDLVQFDGAVRHAGKAAVRRFHPAGQDDNPLAADQPEYRLRYHQPGTAVLAQPNVVLALRNAPGDAGGHAGAVGDVAGSVGKAEAVQRGEPGVLPDQHGVHGSSAHPPAAELPLSFVSDTHKGDIGGIDHPRDAVCQGLRQVVCLRLRGLLVLVAALAQGHPPDSHDKQVHHQHNAYRKGYQRSGGPVSLVLHLLSDWIRVLPEFRRN